MNLLKLMSAANVIGTVREKPTVFVTEDLPSFGWPRASEGRSGSQPARFGRGFWQSLWPFQRERPSAPAAPVARESGGAGWLRLRRRTDPAQRELAFERLKPVRNDLRDEDYEVTTRRVVAAKGGGVMAGQHVAATSSRQELFAFENPAR
jgi:hypothetical protein